MKKNLLFAVLFCLADTISHAQVLCVYCYSQNDSISSGVHNFMLNGDFENTTCAFNQNSNTFCPNSSSYNCNIANWTCTGGGTGTYACFYDSNYWYVDKGTHSPYLGNAFCQACSTNSGDTSCLNNTGCVVTGIPAGYPLSGAAYGDTTGISLRQTVSGLVSGHIYVLEFWAGGENYQNYFSQMGLFAVDVGFGNTFLRCKPTGPHTGVGTRFLVEFRATSSSHTIKFTNWGHICALCSELVLDDIKLYVLDELSPSAPICSSGIAGNNNSSFIKLYPSPVINDLTIETRGAEPEEISIYDVAGRKLIQQEFMGSSVVRTESFVKGIYLYIIKNKIGIIKTGKIIKE